MRDILYTDELLSQYFTLFSLTGKGKDQTKTFLPKSGHLVFISQCLVEIATSNSDVTIVSFFSGSDVDPLIYSYNDKVPAMVYKRVA